MAIATVEAPVTIQGRSLYLAERGVMVELPPNCNPGIDINPETGQIKIDPLTRTHLLAITKDPILKGRYPTAEHGEEYMNGVSAQWRDRLLEYAGYVTDNIKGICRSIGKERFAVVLYGSLARNLAKYRTDSDPSNLDLVIIGNFTTQERRGILDGIRGTRQQITTEIKAAKLCRCTSVRCQCYQETANYYWSYVTAYLRNEYGEMTSFHSGLIERAGVVIQSPETIRSQGYGEARKYLSSCGRALYDPVNIWRELENEALVYLNLPPLMKTRVREGKPVDKFLESFTLSLRNSARFQNDSRAIDRVIQSLRQNS